MLTALNFEHRNMYCKRVPSGQPPGYWTNRAMEEIMFERQIQQDWEFKQLMKSLDSPNITFPIKKVESVPC